MKTLKIYKAYNEKGKLLSEMKSYSSIGMAECIFRIQLETTEYLRITCEKTEEERICSAYSI